MKVRLVRIIAALIVGLTAIVGLFAFTSTAHAQSCDVTATFAYGTGPTCLTYGNTYTFSTNGTNAPGAGSTIEVHLNVCVDMIRTTPTGWTSVFSGGINDQVLFCGGGGTTTATAPSAPNWTNFNSNTKDWGTNSASGSFSYSITIYQHGVPTPTATPTSTATPTPTPPAPSSSGISLSSCPLLGQANANFQNLPGKWLLTSSSLKNPDGQTSGLAMPVIGSALLTVSGMNKTKQYKIQTRYHVTEAGDATDFLVFLGKSPVIQVGIPAGTTASQTYETDPSNFTPTIIGQGAGVDSYTLTIKQPDDIPNLSLVVDYICVVESLTSSGTNTNGSSSSPVVGGTAGSYVGVRADVNAVACTVDNSNAIAWAISVLWNCGIKIGFERVLSWASTLLYFVQVSVAWIGDTISVWWQWIIDTSGVIWRWISGAGVNILTIVYNAAADVFNRLGLSDLFNHVIDFIAHLPQTITQITTVVGVILNIIGYWVGRIINIVLSVIYAIPVLFTSLINGFNTSSATVPVWAPSCNSSNPVLYGPCLSFYVMDNTIWDGPAFFIMPVFLGLLAWETLVWALKAVKEGFSK